MAGLVWHDLVKHRTRHERFGSWSMWAIFTMRMHVV